MNFSTILNIGGSIAALAVGALAATWWNQSALRDDGRLPDASLAPADSHTAPGRPIDPALAEGLRAEKGARRWLILLAATENATAQDMPSLIRAAGKDPAAVRMLAALWAELDPKHMFRSMYADYLLPEDAPGALPGRWELTEALMEQWTKRDPAGVVKALTDVPGFSQLQNLRMKAVNKLMITDVEQGLRAMSDWNIRNFVPDLKKFADWAQNDPKRAVDAVLKIGGGSLTRAALKQLGKVWAQRNPEEGLGFASTLTGKVGASLGADLISAWAQKDLAAAVKFAEGQANSSFRSAVGTPLAAEWAKTDAAAALAWSNEHLRGAARSEAISRSVKAAAEKDIAAAAELVAGMETGTAQNHACASVFETWFNKGKEQRDIAFEWLAGISDPAMRQAAIERVQWNWLSSDAAGVKDFISGPYGKIASATLVSQVAYSQAAKDPEATMAWAGTLGDRLAADARKAVLKKWLWVRPEAAADYARKLPSGEARDQAIRTISQGLVWQSPRQAADWYHTLPAAEQKIANEIYQNSPLSTGKRQELEKALAR